MDVFLTFLLDKGGILGLLLLVSILWILYREKFYYQNNKSNPTDKSEVSKILFIVEDLKTKKDEWVTKSDVDKLIKLIIDVEKNQDQNNDKIEKLIENLNKLYDLNNEVDEKIQELWKWHAVLDNEGVPVWYVRKSLEESIDNLDLTINNLQDKCISSNELLRTDLIQRLQKVNEERVSELKFLLEGYNKTITDLIITLEKLKSLIKPD